jgi:Tfp pilus assembly protein PilF
LPSLLDAILRGYGFTEDISLPLAEKQKQCIKILTELPALLIADDIDSLEEKNEGAIEFLVSDLASTPSKILLTSRRVPFGFRHIKTEVSGLSKEDGEKFISSRIRLFKLDKDNPKTRFSPRVIQEILQITESSPLYIEDLLRLCINFAVEEAISDWKKEGGDNARKYALEKEFDLLTPSAKETVFACCIPPSAVSLSEIQVITGKSLDLIKSEMVAIQNLFLVSHPKPFDSGERYDVNTNTRMLILRTYGHTDTFNRLKRSYEGQFGRLNIRQKNEVASHIREAISIQRLGRHKEAEKLLQSALEHYPNNPDLTAQLGMIYYYWQPRRLADASHQFELAEQLGCKHERMYRTWANMEIDEREWTKAIAVAEAGINIGNESAELYRLAGYAHSRQGQYLKRSYHTDLAQRELLIADSMLQKGLKDPEELAHYEERIQNSRAFRALVINCAELGQIEEMHRYIDRWQREYPQDPYVIREGERFRAAYPIR